MCGLFLSDFLTFDSEVEDRLVFVIGFLENHLVNDSIIYVFRYRI